MPSGTSLDLGSPPALSASTLSYDELTKAELLNELSLRDAKVTQLEGDLRAADRKSRDSLALADTHVVELTQQVAALTEEVAYLRNLAAAESNEHQMPDQQSSQGSVSGLMAELDICLGNASNI